MEVTIRKRPALLTVVCVIGYIWIVFSLPAVFSPSVKKLGDWFPALFGLLVASSFISYIGVWNMKRWGCTLFISTFFIKECILVLIKDVSYAGLVVSIFFMVSMICYYKRMDVNL